MPLIMQMSPLFYYFPPLSGFKHSPQHSVLECLTPAPYSSLNVKDQKQTHTFMYFNLYVLRSKQKNNIY